MTAWLFPAGDPREREAVAIHRLTSASPPRRWSVEVNRNRVKPGDYAFLWQTGDDDDLWRPGVWAVGFVDRYDRTRLERHWRPGVTKKTTYAQLELWWMQIVDRQLIRMEADNAKSIWAGSIPGSRMHGQMRSPLALSDDQANWILDRLNHRFRAELDRRIRGVIDP